MAEHLLNPETARPSALRAPGLRASVGAGLLATGIAVAQAAVLSHAVDAAFLRGADRGTLASALVGLAALACLRGGVVYVQERLAQHASAAVRAATRSLLLRRVLALGPRWCAGERSGELAGTLTAGVEALDAYVAQYQPQRVLALLAPALVLAAVAFADPLSGAVLAVTGPLMPLFAWLIGGAARERTRAQWVTSSRLWARLHDALAAAATLRAFGRSGDEARVLERTGEAHRALTMETLRLAFVSALALEAFATLGTAVVAVQVGLRLLHAGIEFRSALFVLVIAPEFYRPFRALAASFHAGLAGQEAMRRHAEILGIPGPLAAPALLVPDAEAPGTPSSDPPSIGFQGVRFAYEPAGRPVLDGLDLELPAGGLTALLGATGAGKSTLAQVLLRFLEPTEGTVCADGRPIRELTPEAWRARVAWVPQRPRLLHGTLRDNLRLGRPDAGPQALEQVIADTQLAEVVASLPRGLDTPIGEGGERLSGGEAQRVALARALLKNAPLLVLDEPMAHLDADTEAALAGTIRRWRRARTLLLIAHRLSHTTDADRIVVLSRGRVAEEGPPARLAAEGRLYPQMLAAWKGRP